ncbi:TonB-dependent receptor [Lysobacter sp. Root690]|uniref:TonB-dependent receptor domain-containing protein n=1 Tax=Lysobacter sp. Root690 TaxID=1736588 RepID=UPI0009EB17B8|nr:TonB-dependent receptor [Lysobacter sp. Root690]
MQVQDPKRSWKHAARPCVLFLALLPCLSAYAADGAGGTARFDIPQQKLDTALSEYARQSGTQLLYSPELATGKKTGQAVRGEKTARQALDELLAGTGLNYATSASGAILISDGSNRGGGASGKSLDGEKQGNVQEVAETQPTAPSPESQADQSAAETTSENPAKRSSATTLDTIVVTAQKKVENIQKVPIAITAFGGKDLGDRKIETGGDLVTATPNVTFSKTNFASYNFQIRGIGTQALSVTTDPAVAVSFNSTPMIRNRLFEQEYLDVERVEVLRGPQGTLYGRNATAGVVNMIPNLANPEAFEAEVKGEVGNFDTRRVTGMVNVPLSDTFAFRVASQYTKRDGYDENTVTNRDVNDRDLLSVRTSLAFKPSERFNASLVWEHFQEDDRRARTGKQLCHNDPGPTQVGATPVSAIDRNYMSQGCSDGSLYDNGAFGVPNGASIPFVLGAQTTGVGYLLDPDGNFLDVATLIPRGLDPYAGVTQSHDLRKIATTYDPKFNAKNDIFQFNLEADLSDHLRLISQSTYTRDQYYSTQDYGRFQSQPIFTNTSTGVSQFGPDGVEPAFNSLPNGTYCDPQLGCSDRLLIADLVDSDSRQWSQEFRLQSSFDGAFNFSLGANYLEYKVDESYYVFSNAFTALADLFFNGNGAGNAPGKCPAGSATRLDPNSGEMIPCVYIDPNPLGSIDGNGHNYFRSRNVAETRSAAIFGEGYWKLSDTVRLTAGVRFTNDRKITTPYPSQTLLADSTGTTGVPQFFGGYVGYGYPALPKITQTWNEPTGRLVLDWSPDLSFTDSTMFYASLSRGYKAGGTNSPAIGANPDALSFQQRDVEFKPEFVNAIEVGMKNVMAGGKFILNGTLFYNDYKDYQVSQIQDRSTFNENFNAKTWGAELEAVWRPTDAFQLSGNVGLLRTRIGSNQYSIDVMDRTAGNSNWMVIKPWLQLASNCIAPKEYVEAVLAATYPQDPPFNNASSILNSFCSTNLPLAGAGFSPGGPYDGAYGFTYDPATDAPNGGAGFAKNVGGNELPNAPHITVSLSPQYTFMTAHGDFTARADLYYQGPSWARIYQDKIDRLHDWGNVNVSLTWTKIESDLAVQLYVKNALGGKAITGTFVNSDDTGLSSNVFIQDPRIIGLSVRKGFF